MGSTTIGCARRLEALIFVLSVLAVFISPTMAHAWEGSDEIVRVGWYESPFNTTDNFGRRSGYAYDYQCKIASYTDWTYAYVEGSWPDLMEMLKEGKIDLMSDVSYTEERDGQMLFSSLPMGSEDYYLFVAADDVANARGNAAFFDGKRVGVNKGSVQSGFFEDWARRHGVEAELVELVGGEEESLEMLRSGELDALVTIDGYYDLETIVPVAKVGSSDVYFVVNNDRPDLLETLDAAMSRIQDENRFYNEALFDKYIRVSGSDLFLEAVELDWLAEHGPIRVGYQDNYLAYCASGADDLTGALRDYLDEASSCMANATLDFDATPYRTSMDAMDALRAGEVDCVFPVYLGSYDAEVRGVNVTTPVMEAEVYALVRSSDRRAFDEMGQVTTAVVKGDMNYATLLVEQFPDWEKVAFPDVPSCLRAVSEGRADCFLISNYRYNNIVELCERYKLSTLDTGKEIGYCFAVGAGEPELYSIITRVEGVVPDATVNAALTRYFAEEEAVRLVDFVRDNPGMAVAFVAVIVTMALAILAQHRMIRAEREAAERKHQVEDLSQRVYVDALTGVRNKGAFYEYLRNLEERRVDGETLEFAVGVLDCDDLKLVNDRHGHERGDEYLKTACRFICRVYQHSPVFRTGGDEFAVVLQGDDLKMRVELADRFEEGMRDSCASADNLWEQVRISAGFAVYDPEVDGSVEHVVHRADEAMYEKKCERKGSRARVR